MNKSLKLGFLGGILGGIFCAVVLFTSAWTFTYDTATPPTTGESPSLGAFRIREFKLAIQERLNIDHYFPLSTGQVSSADAGKHRQITFVNTDTGSDPNLYTKTSGTNKELTYIDANGTEKILTSNGTLNIAGGTDLTIQDMYDVMVNNTWLMGKKATSGYANIVKLNASNLPEFGKGAVIEDSCAPTVDGGIATKKYVDDNKMTSIFGSWDSKISDKDYQAATDGFVTAYAAEGGNSNSHLRGYTDSANPPTTLRVDECPYGGSNYHITFPVRKNDYWKVVSINNSGKTIYWLPVGN